MQNTNLPPVGATPAGSGRPLCLIITRPCQFFGRLLPRGEAITPRAGESAAPVSASDELPMTYPAIEALFRGRATAPEAARVDQRADRHERAMVVMNYCSWVPIRRAHPWELAVYEREVVRTAGGLGDPGVIDGDVLSPTLEGLRVMLVPAAEVAA